MVSRFTLTVALTLSCTLLPQFAVQAEAQDPQAARAAFERGEAQFNAGNHQLALEAFRESQSLLEGDERRQTLIGYNVARALEELGRLEEARQEYVAFLTNAPDDAPWRQETRDRIRELDARAAAEGPTEPASSTLEPRSATSNDGLVAAGIATLAAGAIVALIAIPTGIATLEQRDSLEELCPGGDCPRAEQARLDDAYLLATLTDVLWVSGTAIAALGAGLLIFGLVAGGEGSDGVSATAMCFPAGGCSAQLLGRW